jgi:hypothetical protein
MTSLKSLFVFLACSFVFICTAQKTIDTIATTAGNFSIPIKIQLPKQTTAKSPIYFFVHGGGWNGGTQNEVPQLRFQVKQTSCLMRWELFMLGWLTVVKGIMPVFLMQ